MRADARHSVSVAGVIVDDRGRVLLTQRADNGQWQAPGGVLEISEGITEGLRREVLEETGLTVEPVALTGVYKNMARGIIALVFRCKATGGSLTLNDEVRDFHWATPDEVSEMVTEAFAVRVLDALHDGTPAIREHDGTHLV
ncbi:NUDIX hydrolase [Thermopolyspora flexuosa]|jgi:ADP-ribose pyrophosphatase YjhB (NUDIX family)|uniref:ADP-ribose pyrophosphatase YjhB (NUDIX family) n=1 Tax=Thermopolyspora flexuosa TaxID=103836 RepID=A0A543ISJ4_9ACTN|nr:NUDIX hydrolase [Thermopolyspora flexuosa]TQM73556.1 ADP-ribose pyrophosphatase YjhB (NUDIX family) [Thermopolyspora flexuosa]GGM82198.1 NUDIX hydrolase [Thermopolyspora flexuosa]